MEVSRAKMGISSGGVWVPMSCMEDLKFVGGEYIFLR